MSMSVSPALPNIHLSQPTDTITATEVTDMDTNTEHALSDTESMDVDNDYTTHNPLHNPE